MTENHDRAIGRIEGKLDRLIEEQKRATQKRGEMYHKIDAMQRWQDDTGRKVADVEQRVKQIERPVAEFNKWRERVIGAAMLMSLVAAVIGGSTVFFWQKIMAFVKQWA